MRNLILLFTKDGLQYQIAKGKNIIDEKAFFKTRESSGNFIDGELSKALCETDLKEVYVISAINHFSLTPEGFDRHDIGMKMISLNAQIDTEKEELMLSINKKYGVQFYYTFPKKMYLKIKEKKLPVHFNFSGEKFLNRIQVSSKKEIHINLYHHQCEFLALSGRRIILYNNLDINSEVDFLYFIMFTLSKIGFGISETYFYVYGETTENDTFISELKKFVKHLKIVFDNIHKKNFIMG
ncbi:DUF3822 family protein [Riemerella columbipharyngis]|uniref:DUF3822 domain-containing protein n=1 Tax=Riemerella columbipharyngis TaxID=1071918 RepID=A0A1G6YP22_9FLAO|nr:DUF3822 family protein [Riemerella columbipharyngis]SDD91417.1 Protein of unknown function [Riemerella columbipharyngis]